MDTSGRNDELAPRARELSLALTAFRSETGSPGEAAFPGFLGAILAGWPYFRENPGLLRVAPLPDDPSGRSILLALVRGKGRSCVILTGHFDTVSASCYGPLASLAFDPEALAPALAASEAGTGAREDLLSGRFLPGRGLLDMKAGLGAGLAALERFAERPGSEGEGSLLFLAVPDEEGLSAGMRFASGFLPGYLREAGLEAVCAINMDCAVDHGEGEEGRAAFLGSVGKLHPFVLFMGRQAHAGAPFEGMSACLAAADFLRLAECSGILADGPMDDGAPPPAALYMRDLRSSYDVTCPPAAFCSFNVLTTTRGPDEVLSRFVELSLAAQEAAIAAFRERAADNEARTGRPSRPPAMKSRAMRFSALLRAALDADPEAADRALKDAREGTEDAAPRCARAALALAGIAGLEGPVAICGFAPPYYPRAALRPGDAWIVDRLTRIALESPSRRGVSLKLRPCFMGISDMSFLCPADGPGGALVAEAESPLAPAPAGDEAPPPIPVVNIGPWGRDYHQTGERLEADYAFRVLPELLYEVAVELLS